MNTREMCEIIDLFRGVELRDGGDFDGLDKKSSTFFSYNSTFHFPNYVYGVLVAPGLSMRKNDLVVY